MRFRSWSGRGHWFDDGSLYRGSRQGRLAWFFDAPMPAAAVNPYHPWGPSVETFVERIDILRRLEAALHENRSFSILGDWRSGKSLLLEVWRRRVTGFGRTVVLLSGEAGECSSISAFVRAVTGLAAPDDPDAAADLLSDWAAARPGGPPVLLVDETDSLVRRFDIRFFERLRGMLGRVVLVLASRGDLDELFARTGSGSPLHNRLEIAWLGLLEEAAAEQLMQRGAARYVDAMQRWAGRHPFFLQLLGYCLVDAESNGASVDAAIDRFRQQADPRLKEWWRILTLREQEDLKRTLTGAAADRRTLRDRGLTTESGHPFGEVLTAWMKEEL